MTKEKYEKNKKFIKEFSKSSLTDSLMLILMITMIPLIALGLDLKLELFTNACSGIFIVEFIWLAGNTIQIIIRAFMNKNYEKKQNQKNTTKQQNKSQDLQN